MKNYRKALVAGAGVLTVLGSVLSDGNFTLDDGIAVGMAVVTAVGVYLAPNVKNA